MISACWRFVPYSNSYGDSVGMNLALRIEVAAECLLDQRRLGALAIVGDQVEAIRGFGRQI